MKYKLEFFDGALADWNAMDGSIKTTLKKLLQQRLEMPHVVGDALQGAMRGFYKINLRKQGYRLIYKLEDDAVIVIAVTVRKRGDDKVYFTATERARDVVALSPSIAQARKASNR